MSSFYASAPLNLNYNQIVRWKPAIVKFAAISFSRRCFHNTPTRMS